jgi:hypothetical protein
MCTLPVAVEIVQGVFLAQFDHHRKIPVNLYIGVDRQGYPLGFFRYN